jgi:hypothetical protein
VTVPGYGPITVFALRDREDGTYLLWAERLPWEAIQADAADPNAPLRMLEVSDNSSRWYQVRGGGSGGSGAPGQPIEIFGMYGFTPAMDPSTRVLFLQRATWGEPTWGEVALPLDGSVPPTEAPTDDPFHLEAVHVIDKAYDLGPHGPAHSHLAAVTSTAVHIFFSRHAPEDSLGLLTDDRRPRDRVPGPRRVGQLRASLHGTDLLRRVGAPVGDGLAALNRRPGPRSPAQPSRYLTSSARAGHRAAARPVDDGPAVHAHTAPLSCRGQGRHGPSLCA